MATSTTFKGQVKPMGKSGHFYESRRHELQAKGFLTGHLAQSPLAPPYTKWGVTNLEDQAVDQTPVTSTGLEDTQAEALEQKELDRSQNVSFGEKLKKMEQKFAENLRKEKALKAKLRQEKLYEELDKKMPEEEEPAEDDEDSEDEDYEEAEDYDSDEMPAKFAHFIANLDGDYTSEDMKGLSDKEVELLALKFKTQNKESLFGEPDNPFIDELKNRMKAKAELSREKAQIRAELKKKPVEEKGFLQELFFD